MIPLVEEQLRIKGYEIIDNGVIGECIIRNALEDAGRKDELSSLGRVLVATNNLILEGKKILSWDNICMFKYIHNDSYTLPLVDKELLLPFYGSVGGGASDLNIAGESVLDDTIVHKLRTTSHSNSNHDMDCSIRGGSSSDKSMGSGDCITTVPNSDGGVTTAEAATSGDKDLLLQSIQDEKNDCTIDAEIECEGRGSIVTSPVDVTDDIHGTSTTVNKQSCSSFPSLEEGKGNEDAGVTSEDMLQVCTEKITKPTGKCL